MVEDVGTVRLVKNLVVDARRVRITIVEVAEDGELRDHEPAVGKQLAHRFQARWWWRRRCLEILGATAQRIYPGGRRGPGGGIALVIRSEGERTAANRVHTGEGIVEIGAVVDSVVDQCVEEGGTAEAVGLAGRGIEVGVGGLRVGIVVVAGGPRDDRVLIALVTNWWKPLQRAVIHRGRAGSRGRGGAGSRDRAREKALASTRDTCTCCAT